MSLGARMESYFSHDTTFFNHLKYFYEQYPLSTQGNAQLVFEENQKEIFEQAVYCFLTPATKSDSADITYKELFSNNFFYKASLEKIADCLRKPPYIRFHNQKAERLVLWRERGREHIENFLSLNTPAEQRQYLVDYVKGMNYKEASHYLRNIGRSGDLVILDRHIINFMKDVKILPLDTTINQLSKKYLSWEKLFYDFIHSDLWIQNVGHSTIPRADFAIWAASVKRADPQIPLERIMILK